jgi:hypothetical protein
MGKVITWLVCAFQKAPMRVNIATKEAVERVMPMPTIFVVSNRRSGTHMTIGMLANNFKPPFRIVKTNHVKAGTEIDCLCIEWMRQMGGIVHPFRDVKDMLVSTYYYRRVCDFILSSISYFFVFSYVLLCCVVLWCDFLLPQHNTTQHNINTNRTQRSTPLKHKATKHTQHNTNST